MSRKSVSIDLAKYEDKDYFLGLLKSALTVLGDTTFQELGAEVEDGRLTIYRDYFNQTDRLIAQANLLADFMAEKRAD